MWHGFSPHEAQTNTRIVSLIRGPGVATIAPRPPSKPIWKVGLAFASVCFSFVLACWLVLGVLETNSRLERILQDRQKEQAESKRLSTLLQNETEQLYRVLGELKHEQSEKQSLSTKLLQEQAKCVELANKLAEANKQVEQLTAAHQRDADAKVMADKHHARERDEYQTHLKRLVEEYDQEQKSNAHRAKLLKDETALREQFETMLQNERGLREELAVQLKESKATSERMAKELEYAQQGMVWRPCGPASSLSNIVQQLLPWPPPHQG